MIAGQIGLKINAQLLAIASKIGRWEADSLRPGSSCSSFRHCPWFMKDEDPKHL